MPKRAAVTDDQQALLDNARRIAELRASLEHEYIEAILTAINAGTAQAEVARAVGVSGETIRQILVRRGYTRHSAGWTPPAK